MIELYVYMQVKKSVITEQILPQCSMSNNPKVMKK